MFLMRTEYTIKPSCFSGTYQKEHTMKQRTTWRLIIILIFITGVLFVISNDTNRINGLQITSQITTITIVDGTTGEKHIFEHEDIPSTIGKTLASIPFSPSEQQEEDKVGYRWLYVIDTGGHQLKIKSAHDVQLNTKHYTFKQTSDYTRFVNAMHGLLE